MKSFSRKDIDLVRTSGLFDTDWYLQEYPDVKNLGMDPVEHFFWIGARLKRNPSTSFNTHQYLVNNPDVAEAGINPLYHYVRFGKAEKRVAPSIKTVNFAKQSTIPNIILVDEKLNTLKQNINRSRRYNQWEAKRESEFLKTINHLYQLSLHRYDRILLSIIMPTFNRSATLAQAIESVLRQTHHNWQLIIVDDGSTDDTKSVVQKYSSDSRIQYLFQTNTGVSAARNLGLAHVQGEYVFYLDSDNLWKDHHLQTLLVFMDHCNLAAAYSGLECIDDNGDIQFYRGTSFLWEACREMNYIDLNCFAHRADLTHTFRFDTSLKRLVDWDLILNITRLHRTAFAPYIGVTYYGGTEGNRITFTEYMSDGELVKKQDAIRKKYNVTHDELSTIRKLHPRDEVISSMLTTPLSGASEKKIHVGYVVWDWPALSQTFVINEVRWLIKNNFDVKVYYKVDPERAASLDFSVESYRVQGPEDLTRLVREHGRTVLHSPFAYPATTHLTWPTANAAKIPFTFMPGGVDISHNENRKRNRIAEVSASKYCVGVITLGNYYKTFLLEQGVPSNKILMERQAVGLPAFRQRLIGQGPIFRIVAIGRFVEKKGFKYLIQATPHIDNAEVTLYGYGPEENSLRNLAAEVGANVTFGGELSNTEALHNAYHTADLFILPCVQASNGDLDGLPTVLLEAMAAGVPVLTTRIANIPDLVQDGITGFLAKPNDPESIAASVKRIRSFPNERLTRLINDASERARSYASIERTMNTLLQCWQRRSLDILLVTYDKDQFQNVNDTIEIVERIYRFTSMPFNLTVVDNNSRTEFKEIIKERFSRKENFEFLELPENTMCGPATNIALARGASDYAVYICSKEGFILRHGWDIEIVRIMDANPNAAIGGHVLSLPQYRTGKQLQNYPSFRKWRGREFVQKNPDQAVFHVQGGFYILRRKAYLDVGGFNEAVPHSGMDVEYSFYLMTKGYDLLSLPNIAAISNKTRPEIYSIVDENTLFVHPSNHCEISKFDRLANAEIRHCVCCGWQGDSFRISVANDMEQCPACGADGFSRSVWRYLSHSGHLQTRPSAFVFSCNEGLEKSLRTICKSVTRFPTTNQSSAILALENLKNENALPGLIVLDHMIGDMQWATISAVIKWFACNGCVVVVGSPLGGDFVDDIVPQPTGILVQSIKFLSEAGAFDWRPITAYAPTSILECQ
ncbi:glycosyltransferase [Phyllobacteriaceae bacterium JZ32]